MSQVKDGIVFLAPLSLPEARLEKAYEESLNVAHGLEEYCHSRSLPFYCIDYVEESREGGFQAATWKLAELLRQTKAKYLVAYLVGHPYDVDYRFLSELSYDDSITKVLWANSYCIPEKGINFGKYFDHICIADPQLRVEFARAGVESRLLPVRWGAPMVRSIPEVDGERESEFEVTVIAEKSELLSDICRELAARNIDVQCFGRSFDQFVPYNQRPALFSRTKVNLVLPEGDSRTVPPLVVEVAANAAFQICWNFENLNEYFEDQTEIISASSVADCVEKIEYYLARPRHRDQIAHAARLKSRLDLAWVAEWQRIFEIVSTTSVSPKNQQKNKAGDRARSSLHQGLISVVIPCYNQATYLQEAVESVIRQTFSHWECIIVDDGSTDESIRVAKELARQHRVPGQIRVIEKINGGLASARNVGISESRGEFVLPLDADDVLQPRMLERAFLYITQNPRAGFVYPQIELFGQKSGLWPETPYDLSTMLHSNSVPYCSVFRREMFDSIGGYNPNMEEGFEDWDFWIGAIAEGWQGIFLPEPLVRYRVKERSMITEAEAARPKLTARIIANHPILYDAKTVAHAAEYLRQQSPNDRVVPAEQ